MIHGVAHDTNAYRVAADVQNDGAITNLPAHTIVETPVVISGLGVLPVRVGALPPTVAELCRREAERVERWIKEASEKGAKIACGGKRKGTRVDPTVLTDVPESATIHHQEVFGPVVNLYPVKTLDEAIAKSNSLNYGLHAAIFTNNVNKAFKAAYELECGGVMINDSTDYRLDSMPFGGVKYSGLGREGLKFSLLEMTEPKVVSFYLPDWRK